MNLIKFIVTVGSGVQALMQTINLNLTNYLPTAMVSYSNLYPYQTWSIDNNAWTSANFAANCIQLDGSSCADTPYYITPGYTEEETQKFEVISSFEAE